MCGFRTALTLTLTVLATPSQGVLTMLWWIRNGHLRLLVKEGGGRADPLWRTIMTKPIKEKARNGWANFDITSCDFSAPLWLLSFLIASVTLEKELEYPFMLPCIQTGLLSSWHIHPEWKETIPLLVSPDGSIYGVFHFLQRSMQAAVAAVVQHFPVFTAIVYIVCSILAVLSLGLLFSLLPWTECHCWASCQPYYVGRGAFYTPCLIARPFLSHRKERST